MNKLTKTERETFEAIGAAICDAKNAADEMPHVTPDTVVKCPECVATFRVGKALVQTKGEAASRRLFKNAARRSESARLLCKPKGKRRLAACSRWKFRFRQAARTPLPLCGTHEKERKTKMKLKIDWKTLGRMIWDAVKPDVDASVVPK